MVYRIDLGDFVPIIPAQSIACCAARPLTEHLEPWKALAMIALRVGPMRTMDHRDGKNL